MDVGVSGERGHAVRGLFKFYKLIHYYVFLSGKHSLSFSCYEK